MAAVVNPAVQLRIVLVLVAAKKNSFRIHEISLTTGEQDVKVYGEFWTLSGNNWRRLICRIMMQKIVIGVTHFAQVSWPISSQQLPLLLDAASWSLRFGPNDLFSLFRRHRLKQRLRHRTFAMLAKSGKTTFCQILSTIHIYGIPPAPVSTNILAGSSTPFKPKISEQHFAYTMSLIVEWLQYG